MSETTQVEKKVVVIYDAEAKNRFDFEVRGDDGQNYDTAHVYGPLSDSRYMQWLRDFNIKGNDDQVDEFAREASVTLWDELISEVENIEWPEGADWKAFIDPSEKVEGLNKFLAVAIGQAEKASTGKRVLGASGDSQVVFTEAWFNGQIARQVHRVTKSTIEFQKKYSRIQQKRFRQEKIGGLRRKAKIEFVPQDERLGELYDEMFVSQEGFANGIIPLRFKTTVIHHLFEEIIEEKKSE